MSEQETRALLATALRILALEGHGDLTFGHASARVDSSLVLVKERGTGLEEAQPNTLRSMDAEGLDLATGRPSGGEMPIHIEIYRARPDVGSVIHTHPPGALAMSAFPDALTYEAAWSADDLPFVEDGVSFYPSPQLVDTADAGRVLASVLGQRRATILANHGLIAVGPNVIDATINAVLLERSLRRRIEILRIASAVGQAPRVIDRDTALSMSRTLARLPVGIEGGRNRALFDYLRRVADRRAETHG